MNETTFPDSALALEEVGEGRYRVANEGDPGSRDVLFGGQILAQAIVAATRHSPGKFVKTIHAVFARAGRVSEPTELRIETVHAGRQVASHLVSAWQGDRHCAQALVLMGADEPDAIHHEAPMPPTKGPEHWKDRTPVNLVFPGAELRWVDDVDVVSLSAPDGPAELSLWYRHQQVPDDRTTNQAVLAWATDGFLIGTAMRPHPGVAQERAHRDLSTGVISHTLTFHQAFSVRDWVLLVHESPFAGGGRTYGRCHVYDTAGRLVASYVQDNLVRFFPEGQAYEGQQRTVM